MAFNMNRPIIKGTPLHKASVAKAKSESIVSQSRTQADSRLIAAASAMGKALVPGEVDFSLDQTIDGIGDARGGRKKKEVKELTDEQKAAAAEKLRKENLKKEYDKEHPGGTLFQDGKYYDASGNEVKQKKVKGEKTPTDNMFNDVDADGNVVSRLFGRARQAVKDKKRKNIDEYYDKNIEKETIKAEELKIRIAQEKEQAKIDAENQAKIDAENLKKDKHKAKVKELKGYQKEKDAADKEAQRLKDIQMAKTFDEPITTGAVVNAFGNQQMQQYTKEQRDRLQTEGVWSDEEEKMVLPEEIVDGEFVSKAEGTSLEVVATDQDGNNQTTNTVVEEKKTLSNLEVRKKRMADKKYNDPDTSQYIKDQMLKEGYAPDESKSPMEMRDDRVYRNARADGPVRKNMIKGGYKPQN